MANNPEKPEDMDLTAQLDHLLEELEKVDPQAVPAEFRKQALPESTEAEPASAGPESESEAEPESQPEAEPEPAVEDTPQEIAEPVAAQAKTDEPETVEPVAAVEGEAGSPPAAEEGLDADTIAGMAEDLLSAQIDSTIESASVEAAAEEPAPAAAEQQPEPTQSLSEGELENQLDALLTQVKSPGATTAETGTDQPVVDSTEAPAAEASGATAESAAQAVEPKPVQSLGEDDLANQIDSLLNEVQSTDAVADEPSADTSSDAAAADVGSAEPTPVSADASDAPGEDAGAVSIDQIDTMLAESASEAIEHGPAPEADIPPGTDEVLEAQAKAEQEAEAGTESDRDAAEPTPVPVDTGAEPVPVPASADAAEPEPVAVGAEGVSGGVSGGGSAADVADELDNDAQAVGRSDDDLTEAAFAEPFQGEQTGAGSEVPPVVINSNRLKKAEYALLMICNKVNKPLDRLSPELRDSIGYAGVLTTGLALFMLLYGVLF